MMKRLSSTGSFVAMTLIELLVVIAIVGILALVILPVASSVRESSRRTEAVSNLRQIGAAMYLYAGDNNDILPGSLNEGQGCYYKKADGNIASYLGTYLGLPEWEAGPGLPFPYFFKEEPAEGSSSKRRNYVMNMRISLDGGETYIEPFGRASNSSKMPLSLSRLGNAYQLSGVPVLFGLDRLNAHRTGQGSVEWDPEYGNVRYILYFDGRVEAEDVYSDIN